MLLSKLALLLLLSIVLYCYALYSNREHEAQRKCRWESFAVNPFLIQDRIATIEDAVVAVVCNKLTANVNEAVTKLHNELRANVAKRNLSTDIYGNIPGSKTLFKLRYDCTNEGLAQATIGSKCKHSSVYMDKVGRGENFITYRLTKKPNAAKQMELFGYAVEDWMMTVEEPLSSDVVYTDTSMEPFANMIYNKTLNFGCSFLFCNETSKIALACVYDKRPKEGEPLYWADSKNNLGCQKPGPCKKVIKGTDVNCDTTSGLCDQDPPASVETTTGETTPTTSGGDPVIDEVIEEVIEE